MMTLTHWQLNQVLVSIVWIITDLSLTHKRLEMHGCVIGTVAADALVLKHQAISSNSADNIFTVSD